MIASPLSRAGCRLRRATAGLLCAAGLLAASPAAAIVGGGGAPAEVAAHTVMIVSTRGASCTGTVLARDLLLTAAHCVGPKGDYAVALVDRGAPELIPATRVALHPGFDSAQFRTRRPTPDLALVKLAAPLPARFRPAPLALDAALPPRGAGFLVAGYGMSADGDEASAGTLRAVSLASVGTTGGIMVRLSPAAGLAGACTGDSGGPAFQNGRVVGVVGWVTAPNGVRGCGGVTGVTLVGLQRDWIATAARTLGSPIAE
ncbi:S1 family peptidase [Aquabacter spiritensis]|uniref:Trypsin n=1 Tax=Aquabacter spiritensis TaxID=933073 RepID=A0A4R3M5U5_9HYPH|nr:trypsin-like serine protease [Aquabacter spiritensis]TCT07629.1 trypsin [Aquabacter spiritensis]